MPERTFEFDAEYSDIIIDDAARTFVHRLFQKYLWLLVAACIMNIVGFVTVVLLLRSIDWGTVAIGLVAALGPVYFPWQYFARLAPHEETNMSTTQLPQITLPATADDGLVTHVHTETPAQVAEYWTPERMGSAKPVPMPSVVVPPTLPAVPMPTPKVDDKSSNS